MLCVFRKLVYATTSRLRVPSELSGDVANNFELSYEMVLTSNGK